MLEFRQKRKIRRAMYSPFTVVILLVVVFVLVKATWGVYTKEAESRTYLNQAQDELDKVATSRSDITSSVASLETPQGVETEIRSQFLVGKPGEQVAVIVDSDSASNTPTSAASSGRGFFGGVLEGCRGIAASIVDFFKF